MGSQRSIKSFWNRAAEENPYYYVSSYGSYDADRNMDEFWASGRAIWTDLKSSIGYSPAPGDTVVEIGCGVGRLTRAISPEVGRVISLDISENMLAIARQANLPNVDFRVAEGFTLPSVPDASVELVLAYCVFQHLPSEDALKSYLQEMHRVLRPGGVMAFTLSSRDWTTRLLPVLRIRAFFRERFAKGGPKGLYTKEWVGIRPSASTVASLSPIKLDSQSLGADRILYVGRRRDLCSVPTQP